MKKFIFTIALGSALIKNVFADCTFVYENKTPHPVTLQGFFLDNGDNLSSKNWIVAESNTKTEQTRVGSVGCNATYQHSGELVTKVVLQNNSGYWVGDKGFLFATDRSYANIGSGKAIADDESSITLSNGIPVSKNKFKILICDSSVDSDDCN